MNRKKVIILVTLTIIITSFHFLVSPVAKYIIENNSEKIIGRKIQIEKLKLNLILGKANINGFVLYENESDEDFVSFEEFNFDIKLLKLFSKQLSFDYINLSAPSVSIIKDEDIFNFSDMQRNKGVKDEKKKKTKKESSNFSININKILIKNFKFRYVDVNSNFEVEEKIDTISYQDIIIHDSLSLNMKLEIENQFDISFDIENLEKGLNIDIILSRLNVNHFNEYLKEYVNLSKIEGEFSGKYNIKILENNILTTGNLSGEELVAWDLENNKTFEIPKIDLEIEKIDLSNKKIIFNSLDISKLYLYINLNNGTFNLQNIVKKSDKIKSEDKHKQEKKNSESLEYEVKEIKLNQGEIEFVDSSQEDEFKYLLNNLDIKINNFNGDFKNIDFALSTDLNSDSSSITIVSTVDSIDEIEGSLDIRALNLTDFNKYYKQFININSLNGAYSGELEYSLKLKPELQLIISGNNSLENISLIDSRSIKVVQFKKLKLDLEEFNLLNNNLTLSNLELDSLNATMYFNQTGSILDIYKKNDSLEEKEGSENTKKKFEYLVKRSLINNSNIEYFDENYETPFKYELSGINLKMDNFSNKDDQDTEYDISVDLNRKGNFTSKGTLTINNISSLDISSEIKELDISDFEPVLERYSPVTFSSGVIDFKAKSKIENNSLNLSNLLQLKNLEILKQEKNFLDIKMPLNLTIGLLEDENREIEFDIPIEGDLSNPELDISKMFLVAIKGTVLQAVKSPIKLLKTFSHNEKSNNGVIKLNYGKKWQTKEFHEKLEKLKKIVDSKPRIKLKISLYNNIEKEQKFLAIDEVFESYLVNENIASNSSISKTDEVFINYVNNSLNDKDSSLSLKEKCEKLLGIERLEELVKEAQSAKIDYLYKYFSNKGKLNIELIQETEIPEEEKYSHIKTELYID